MKQTQSALLSGTIASLNVKKRRNFPNERLASLSSNNNSNNTYKEVLYEISFKENPAYVSAAVAVHSKPLAIHQTLPLGQALDEKKMGRS